MARRKGWRAVKSRLSYTVDEVARNQGVSKGTVRRWLTAGLVCLDEQRPMLILGADLIDFLKSLHLPKQKCAADEFYCFGCKAPRHPAFGAIEMISTSPTRHRLRALCAECTTVMHKAASIATIEALKGKPGLSISLATEALSKGTEPG